MARGVALSVLVTDLRAELRQSLNVAHQSEWDGILKRYLGQAQRLLWLAHEWPFLTLTKTFTLTAAEPFYAVPAGVTFEGIREVQLVWDRNYQKMEYGIGVDDYSIFDSFATPAETHTPPVKWEYRLDDTGAEKIELWPVPDTTAGPYYVRILAKRALAAFAADNDVCTLDGDLLVLEAAAQLLESRNTKDAGTARAKANSMLDLVRGHNAKLRSVSPGRQPPARLSPPFPLYAKR